LSPKQHGLILRAAQPSLRGVSKDGGSIGARAMDSIMMNDEARAQPQSGVRDARRRPANKQ
jgi:hypothetical protein